MNLATKPRPRAFRGRPGPRGVTRHDLLGPAEERALIARHQAGDRSATARLVECNQGLVARIAQGAFRSAAGLDFEDLCQHGNLGLLVALDKFNFGRTKADGSPHRLTTYASPWIYQRITRAIQEERGLIRVPVYAQDLFAQVERGKIDPASLTNSHRQSVRGAGRARSCLALGRPAEGGRDWDFGLASPETGDGPGVDEEHAKALRLARDMAADLPDRHRQMIELRFGLDDGRRRSGAEIARTFGVSRERVNALARRFVARVQEVAASEGLAVAVGGGR